jgi:hypothetical protein
MLSGHPTIKRSRRLHVSPLKRRTDVASVIRQPEPLLSKVNTDDVIFCNSTLFVQPGLQLKSEKSMSIYSSASIAENTMLGAATTLLRLSTQQTYLSSMVNFMGKYMEPFEIIINSIVTTKK